MVFNTLMVPSKKGLINLTFIAFLSRLFLPMAWDYLLMLSMIFLIFSFRTSAVNGLTM